MIAPARRDGRLDGLAERITPLLATVYGDRHPEVVRSVVRLAGEHADRLPGDHSRPDHTTACLITYGGSLRRAGEAPLRTLARFLDEQVGEVVTDVHLLPVFPWTSDDGFGVVDHRAVDRDLGTWEDVEKIAEHRGLMLDFVANHTSTSSPWFQGWLAGEAAYEGFYVERDPDFDDSRVVRPRTSPLQHAYRRPDGGTRWAWTTFGEDQVDVDVREPRVLLELTDVLLGYVAHGAATVRLDAIGFLYKESGTTCLHLPQTHAVIKTWRAVLDHVAPGSRLLTETNVPHAENVSYFGDGHDEAAMVYQFALPPLVLHAFVSGSTRHLGDWAASVRPVSDTATWFNFLASHDGIGVRATEGLLDDAARRALVERVESHGGRASWAALPDGSRRLYELNLGYLDALCTPQELTEVDVVVAKALAAHAILLCLVGVPAIYVHSLLGSTSDLGAMETSGINRRVNRAVLDADRVASELREDPRRRGVFTGLRHLLEVRRGQPALSPYAAQRVEPLDPRVLAVRRAEGTPEELLCVTNVTSETVLLDVHGDDVLGGGPVGPLSLGPWSTAWVRPG